MLTPNEFWLALHTLSRAYDQEGETTDERVSNIVDEFERMLPVVREQVLREFQSLAYAIETIRHPLTEAAHRLSESATVHQSP